MSIATIDVRGGSATDIPAKPPKTFSPTEPPQARGASCNWFDDDCALQGAPGGPGSQGITGAEGPAGGNGGSITFQVGIINGAV